jgi:hypothetical protein
MKTQQVIALCAMLIIGAGRSSPALAAAPHCHPSQSTGYCQYDGKVARAYINAYKQIILYFDAPLNIPDATNVGLAGVTVNNAALYNTTTDPDFAKSLFAAMLAAQARGSTISVQMMSVSGGYLVIDRIWVDQ